MTKVIYLFFFEKAKMNYITKKSVLLSTRCTKKSTPKTKQCLHTEPVH